MKEHIAIMKNYLRLIQLAPKIRYPFTRKYPANSCYWCVTINVIKISSY